MKKIALLFVATLFSVASFAQTKWNVDNYHSFLNFSVKHLGISFVDGRFDKYEGTFEGTPEDLTKGTFKFSVDMNSVNTSIEMRDNHLKADDFFAAEKFPAMTFESKSIKKVGKDQYKLEGNLTIRNITKPVTFDLTYGGLLKDDGQGNTKLGFQASTTINRFDFGVAYDPSGQAIAKDVKINVNLEFNQVK
ncbi:YceI family protein [Myroides odoratimimus]|uniref:YceI family protein n=1 Tax=Myroides odoratimimus TaxID=76832 RepID=UPI00257491FA|nr:YceI family protein [Myroides odoratimimus]MDM1038530.1 polyisoprenoid-binding protein [Myroides odoratimimus]MDM1052729.1 polyisoprenoid-binding protein [Myroides odoratimimus]MDM1458963.1 polyisoprenoid-binding protein [Myroides odoratimimus]